MSGLIPFEQAKVPANLSKFAGLFGGNAALATRSGPSYDVLTIKGKVWRVVDATSKERVALKDDEGNALQAVHVVVVRANENLSKVFYKTGYEEGSDAPPDCSSNDGIKPDAMVKDPQCKTCAACDHNVWGTGKEGKGRACGDSRRIAVAPENDLSKVMLLRVPAASLKGLAEFGSACEARGLPYQAVVARVSFDIESASPKLVFKPRAVLSEAMIGQVAALQEDETVKAIIGLGDSKAAPTETSAPAAAPAAATSTETAEEAAAANEAAVAAAEKARKAAERKAKKEKAAADLAAAQAAAAKAAEEADDDDDDDEPAPPVAKAAKAGGAADLPPEVANMLDGLDLDD